MDRDTTFKKIAEALLIDYTSVYCVNAVTGEYTWYSIDPRFHSLQLEADGRDFFTNMARDAERVVYEEDRHIFTTDMRREKLLQEMKKGSMQSVVYRLMIDGRPVYHTLRLIRDTGEDNDYFILGVLNIDEEYRKQLETRKLETERRVFNQIAESLASHYDVIYYINVEQGGYVEFKANNIYGNLEIQEEGLDFFEESVRNAQTLIFPEDRGRVLRSLDRDYLVSVLKSSKQFSMEYRLLFGNEPHHTRLTATWASDRVHLIIGVENIDGEVRRKTEQQKALRTATEAARRDELTGVGNKNAYQETERAIQEKIDNGSPCLFALVVCDLNNLKQVNDTSGHKAGDDYIRDGCGVIQDIFSNSAVYRIGGDEFVAVLTDRDYVDRHTLFNMLRIQILENLRNGSGPVMATGIAAYDSRRDGTVSDVFDAADRMMYADKNKLKSQPDETGETRRTELKEQPAPPPPAPEQEQKTTVLTADRVVIDDRESSYYFLLEKLLKSIAVTDGFDIDRVYSVLTEMCCVFRVAKGETVFYENEEAEKRGVGEEYVCYDNGNTGDEILEQRVVTGAKTVVVSRVYLEKGEAPWTEKERERLGLVQRTIFSFVSRERLKKIVERLSFYDDAGYPNLQYFFRYIETRSRQGTLAGCAALLFNLRHFSLVNQRIGRVNADLVMRIFISQIADMLGRDGTVCRMGGDNFCVLCPQDKLQTLTLILRSTSVMYNSGSGDKVRISANAGVFVIPEGFVYNNPGDIMDRINPALQQARIGGGDQIVFYNERMIASKERMMEIRQQLAYALHYEEFSVYYQPKVSVYTGELTGAEALCRWFRDGRMIPPMEFIPVLEQNTDICKLDFYMLDHVCRDIRRWMDEGRRVVRVSVNLSRKHMLDEELLEHLLRIIDRNGVPHRYIEFELTETTTDVEFTDLKRVVHGLAEEGISIAVDDFGVGFSSMNLIRDIPWDVIKVDKSFLPVDDDNLLSKRSIMFRHVVGMAKELGLTCVAEGVETEKQVEILRDNNCDIAQGYWFDRPLPCEEYEKRLDGHVYQVEY